MLEQFRNEVFCRRETNQHKAKQIWNKLCDKFDSNDKMLFEIEWRHYLMGEIDINDFAYYFDKFLNK